MSTAAPPTHPSPAVGSPGLYSTQPTSTELWRLTVDQYERMAELGILLDGDPVELLDGFLVWKMTKNPPHTTACNLTRAAVEQLLPPGWHYRGQDPIRLDNSEPEPDGLVVAGDNRTYAARHPVPGEIALVIEVSDTTLTRDREWKRRIYARNAIPVYWVVNLVDRVLEIYTQPSGPVTSPDYGHARVLHPGDSAELVINGAVAGTVQVADLLP
jgi:Uma2 family endonuclease